MLPVIDILKSFCALLEQTLMLRCAATIDRISLEQGMRKRKLQSSVDLGQRIIAMPAFVLETPRHRSVYPVLLENVSLGLTKPRILIWISSMT